MSLLQVRTLDDRRDFSVDILFIWFTDSLRVHLLKRVGLNVVVLTEAHDPAALIIYDSGELVFLRHFPRFRNAV